MLKLKDGILVKRIDDEGIIVDTNTGRYLAPNRIALEMITAMMDSDNYEEVIARLMNQMDIDRGTIEVDLKVLGNRLVELGLVSEAAPM